MTDMRAAPEPALPAFDSGFCAARNRRFLLVAAILASALGFIDGTVVAIALPAMRDSLGATLGQTVWFSNAYMLTLSALILVGGSAGDRFGLARVFGSGIVLFVAASLLCGLAQSPEMLIAARAAQGVGAAMMVPGSLALIARTYPEEERGRAIGIWAAASAITTAAGPILGGALLSTEIPGAWRWIFLINLPLGAIALYLLVTRVADDRVAAPETAIDWAGAVLITAALGAFALGLTEAEHGGALSAGDWGLMALGLVLLVAFIFVERRAPAPMLPLEIFNRPGFSAANLVTFILYFALSAVLFYLPMTVIAGWGRSPLEASALFVPLTVFIGLFSSRVGALADTTGPAPLIAGGAALVGLGYLLMGAATPAQAYWTGIVPGVCLMGAGMALVVTPLSTVVMSSAGPEAAGTASGVNNAVSRIAGLLAVAAMGPVAAAGYVAAGGMDSFGAILPDGADRTSHAGAMSAAMAAIALICAVLSLAAAAIAWIGLRRKPAARG